MSKNVGVEWMTMIADLAYLCSVAVVSYGLVTQPHVWTNVFLLVPMAMVVALWVSDRRIKHLFAFSAVALFIVGGLIEPLEVGVIRSGLILIPLCYVVLFPGSMWPIAVAAGIINGYLYQLTSLDVGLFIEIAAQASAISIFATMMAYFYIETRKQAQIYQLQSITDFLTKLPNLQAFYEDIKEVNQDNAERFGILHIGLDGFKHINDRLGYRYGDMLLVAFAQHIDRLIGGYGKFYRLGGDEFALVVESTELRPTLVEAVDVLRRHEKTLFNMENTSHRLGFGVGIALAKDAPNNLEVWIKNADFALYKALSQGAGYVCWFDDQLLNETIRQHQIETEIRAALLSDQFVLYYQPKVSIGDAKIIGAEALIRWKHPQLGSISPAEFIPIAEKTAQIVPLGQWILRKACEQVQAWHVEGIDVCVSVNVSTVQFDDADLFKAICEILREVQLPSHLLQIEITESTLMKDPEGVTEICNQLRALGVSIAVDDFGVEYSCLKYLKHLPVDVLKIDKYFVNECAIHEADRILLKTIVQMGHSLDISVVAEGVENEQQLEVLRQEKCDAYQGYLYSQPLTPSEFISLVEHHNQSMKE
ncbi:putative bifunctional diguanylate cyclase/phosphodiesterase [Vibrio tetraodonis]|uniref:putative bifunctional diguanylate cyclase/phosphodiesterase n=1 Tax=Vibrio tetraodonis TaxID=2231647 RepID=UPI000E0C5357|nr:bifunctional diguanylate cyclase/phosphodiesterase [Vibrio tetraodonis]